MISHGSYILLDRENISIIYIYNLGKSQSQSVYNFRFATWHIVHWNILTVDAFNFTCTTCNHLFQSPINYELTTVFISRGIFHLLFYRFVHYVWALKKNFNDFNSISLSLLLVKNISLLLRVWSLLKIKIITDHPGRLTPPTTRKPFFFDNRFLHIFTLWLV